MFYGELFALLAACLWGTAPIFVRKGLPHANASGGVLCGLLASLPLMALVFVFHPRSVTRVVTPEAALWFVAAGISGPRLGRLFNYLGVSHLGAAKSTPLVNTAPLFTTVFALLFLQEDITLKILCGILSVVAGVVVLTGQNRGKARTGSSIPLLRRCVMGRIPSWRNSVCNQATNPCLARASAC